MEKDLGPIQIKLSPSRFVSMCRCVKDDFYAYYQECMDDPYADNTERLDRMEEDLDLLEGLLPYLRSQSTEDSIRLAIADFRDKIAEATL